jgi:hypothetical protein
LRITSRVIVETVGQRRRHLPTWGLGEPAFGIAIFPRAFVVLAAASPALAFTSHSLQRASLRSVALTSWLLQ